MKFKKVLAIALSFVISFVCLMPAFAATSTLADNITGTSFTDELLKSASNLLYGAAFETNKHPEEMSPKSFTLRMGAIDANGKETSSYPTVYGFPEKTVRLTNGDYSENFDTKLNGTTLWSGDATEGFTPRTDAYYEVNIKLDSVYTDVKFLLIDSVSSKHRVTSYSIYASATADALFEGEPIISRATDTKRFKEINFGEKEIQFVSIRIYGICTQSGIESLGLSSAYLRLSEAAMTGKSLGVVASASVSAPEYNSLTSASTEKIYYQPGETAVFTTENSNPDLIFEGWKNEKGEIVSIEPNYSLVITNDMQSVSLTAAYSFKKGLLLKESFEGNTTVRGKSGASTSTYTKGTAEDFSIAPRQGAENSTILKYDKNDTPWSYAVFENNGKDILKDFPLQKNAAYKFSFWYYIESVAEEDKPLFYFAPSITYQADPINSPNGTSFTDAAPCQYYGTDIGKWIKSEHYFYTYDTETLFSYFAYAAGKDSTTGVVYFDEIVLEKASAIEIDCNENDTDLEIELHKNYVGGYYNELYGPVQIAELGSYTIYPETGKVITSATLGDKALTPSLDGSYTFELETDTSLKVETAIAENWAGVTINQKSGSGKFEQITDNGANYAAKLGEDYSFKFITGANANPVVTVNDKLLTAENGVYTVKNVSETLNIKVVCKGDEFRGTDGKTDAKGNDLSKYVKEIYDIPLWQGDTLFHETVTIFEGRETARLLYPIDDIISVRSFDLKTEYVWGVDYDINEKGELIILEGNSFPCYEGEVDLTKIKSIDPIGYLYNFGIDVTFKHSKVWEDGYQAKPVESKLAELPKLYNKLKNKEDVEIVFYGASSTVGASSSGAHEVVDWTDGDGTNSLWTYSVMMAPYVPTWARQTVAKLRSDWGYEAGEDSGIKFVNRSCHGRKAMDAANEVTIQAQLGVTNPDVVVIGFSGNDGTDPNFISYIEDIILWTRENLNPNCEFILASSSMNGSNSGKELALMRAAEFEALAEKYAGKGVIYAPTLATSYDMFNTLLGCDYLENNLHHNNDFGARAFTSVMAGLLSAPEGCSHKGAISVLETPATCKTTGEKAHYHCDVCDKNFCELGADAVPVEDADLLLAINLNNHEGAIVSDGKGYPATCTKTGMTDGTKYACCDAVVSAGSVIKATGHKYGAYKTTTKATTSKDGVQTATCSCGAKLTKKIYKASSFKLSVSEYTYSGSKKTPTITVKDSKGTKLKKDTDYTVKFGSSTRKSVGKYKVTITLKGNYSGSKTLYFTILPKNIKLKSVSAGSKKITVKWTKTSSHVKGYQIQYSTSSSFKNAKTVKVTSYKTASKTISKLKAKKKYYVRIRAYKTVSGKTYYSKSWSSKKYATTKK